METIEYKVTEVTRTVYLLTRYRKDGKYAGSTAIAEFKNPETAHSVMQTLALQSRHERVDSLRRVIVQGNELRGGELVAPAPESAMPG